MQEQTHYGAAGRVLAVGGDCEELRNEGECWPGECLGSAGAVT